MYLYLENTHYIGLMVTDKIVRSGVVGRGTIKIWFGVGLLHFAMPAGNICTFTPLLFFLRQLVRQSTNQNKVWVWGGGGKGSGYL